MIHAQREHFDERNPVLLCLLGLASVAGGLGAVLSEAGGAPAATAPPPSAGDDEPVLALLGAASFATSLGEALRRAVPLLALDDGASSREHRAPLRGLLA